MPNPIKPTRTFSNLGAAYPHMLNPGAPASSNGLRPGTAPVAFPSKPEPIKLTPVSPLSFKKSLLFVLIFFNYLLIRKLTPLSLALFCLREM
jgi:hypothetical protein